MKNQNNNDSKDNIVVKVKFVMTEHYPFNLPNTEESDLLGYFVGVLPSTTDYSDANLEE